MKKLFTIAALAITVFTASTANAKDPAAIKLSENNTFSTSRSFGVSMYQIKDSETVRLMIETEGKLTLKITDAKGRKLNAESVFTSKAINLNLSEVPAGQYFVEVSNGAETITRQVTKTTTSSNIEL